MELLRAWTCRSRFNFQLTLAHILEYDEGSVTPAWELGKLTGALDPYNHPQSMHARVTSAEFAGETWFDFIIHQTAGSSENFRLPFGSGEFQSLEDDITLTNEEYALGLPIVQGEFRTTDVTLHGRQLGVTSLMVPSIR